jgi:putative transcriptional regulator
MKNSVKLERVKINMTQQELAGRTGVSRQTIHSIENQRYTPSTALAIKLSDIFQTTVNELFQLEPED